MSQKTIWLVIVIIIILGGVAWYAGLVPGMQSAPAYTQGAAAGNTKPAGVNAGATPSVAASVTAAQQVSVALAAAGNNSAKVQASAAAASGAIAALAALLPQLQLAVDVSSNRGNNLSAATAALQDYAKRISLLNSSPINAANAATIAASLNAIVADISVVNTALQGVKFK